MSERERYENEVAWLGPPDVHGIIICDICDRPLAVPDGPGLVHFIDGRTIQGPWALMCVRCHYMYGVGLGTGKGQKYDRFTGKKVEG